MVIRLRKIDDDKDSSNQNYGPILYKVNLAAISGGHSRMLESYLEQRHRLSDEEKRERFGELRRLNERVMVLFLNDMDSLGIKGYTFMPYEGVVIAELTLDQKNALQKKDYVDSVEKDQQIIDMGSYLDSLKEDFD